MPPRPEAQPEPVGSTAERYAETLLGHPPRRALAAPSAAADWAASGAMWLTGRPEGPPRLAPGPLAACMRAAVAALAECAASPSLRAVDAPALLGERAALAGLRRRGARSPGGSCRLLPTRRGWLALNLAREADRELLPAWLEAELSGPPWPAVARELRRGDARTRVERARLLGLPAALVAPPPARPPPWRRLHRHGLPRAPFRRAPRVLDLSSLWAGPLATHLLGLAGAEVVKLESPRRPDGARRGPAEFYDLLNAGKASVALDFRNPGELPALGRLLDWADIVVESARPRALRQLGLHAENWLAARAGRSWLSITGYGRAGPAGQWVAFGDDAAVAAGLAWSTGSATAPLFCGDAIADPLTGAHAALAAWQAWQAGGGVLIELALRDVVAHTAGFACREPAASLRSPPGRVADLRVVVEGSEAPVRRPRARPSLRRARALGADTAAVLARLPRAC